MEDSGAGQGMWFDDMDEVEEEELLIAILLESGLPRARLVLL